MSDPAICCSWTFVAQSISCGDLARFLPAIVGSFSLKQFCLEVDHFRDQLGSEINENAVERITCHALYKGQATVRLPYILRHNRVTAGFEQA